MQVLVLILGIIGAICFIGWFQKGQNEIYNEMNERNRRYERDLEFGGMERMNAYRKPDKYETLIQEAMEAVYVTDDGDAIWGLVDYVEWLYARADKARYNDSLTKA